MNLGRLKKAVPLTALGLSLLVLVPMSGITTGLNALTQKVASSLSNEPSFARASQAKKLEVRQTLGSMPLNFIQNQGQMDQKVSHYLQGSKTSIYFTSGGLTYILDQQPDPKVRAEAERQTVSNLQNGTPAPPPVQEKLGRHIVKLDFIGANNVNAVPLDQSNGKVSYFKGPKDQWKTGVPTSSKLMYKGLWPGIDLVYSGTGEKLKYDFHVAPGADPSQIKLAYRGATSVELNDKGQLTAQTPQGPITDDKPFTYQLAGGQRNEVHSSYALTPQANGAASYGFNVGSYDKTKALVIDPAVFVYSGFIGGDGGDDTRDIAVDSTGAAYVAGTTSSTEPTFPELVGPDLTINSGNDAYIAKISPAGAFVYAGYIGGAGNETGWGVAVDPTGAAYVVGLTTSNPDTFPVLVGPQLVRGTGNFIDRYVAKVNPSGTGLVYAGYIGANDYQDYGNEVAVDSAGHAYVTGVTNGTSFPTVVGPRLAYTCSGYCSFITKVKSDGSGFVYSSYIGAGFGMDIDVDSSGAAYAVGSGGGGTNFPYKVGPDLTANGADDTWIVKVKPDGTDFDYAGLIGGSAAEGFRAYVAVDQAGAAHVVGSTGSYHSTFPDKVGPDLTYNGGGDAFIAKVRPDGTGLMYAGYIGGSGNDVGNGVAVDASGAYVVGSTTSTQTTFPVKDGPDLTQNGGTDTFIAKVKPSGRGLLFSGFIGGTGAEGAGGTFAGVATDKVGGIYVSGNTESTESSFPALVGPDLDYNGGGDAFVTKISSPFAPKRPPADFNGNGTTDASVYRNGTWYIKDQYQTSWGGDPTDKAVPGYYNAGAIADVAVYRGSTGVWYVKDQFETQWGGDPSDIPVPGDYNGDGITDLAVYRKSTGTWWVKDQFAVQWGGDPTDIPVPADYDGDRITDLAVWRKGTGTWYVKDMFQAQWGGQSDDVPVPGDYDNDGAADLAVYRTSAGTWYIKDQPNVSWGGASSDIPVPGDYNNDLKTDIAVYRKALGSWHVMGDPEFSWGGDPADKPLPLPSSIRD